MKNNKKGFIVPLLLSIIALLVIGGIYVYVSKKTVVNYFGSQDSIYSTSTSANSQNADWRTYQSEKYGFELNYPSNLNFEIQSYYYHDTGAINPSENSFDFSNTGFGRLSIAPLGGAEYGQDQLLKTEQVHINGIIARQREFGDTNGIYGLIIDQFSNKQYPNFEILLTPMDQQKNIITSQNIDQFNKIISTLTFTK